METPDQRAERLKRRRKKDKLGEYLRSIGKPLLSKDIEEVQHRLRQMHRAGGMSTSAMAEESGVARDVIAALIAGVRRCDHSGPDGEAGRLVTQMRSSTIERLMAFDYIPPSMDTMRGGARLPPHGKRRRLQALAVAGYTTKFLADQLGMQGYGLRNLNMFMHGHKGKNFSFASSVFQVAQLYDKLSMARPEDFPEIPRDRIKASRTLSKKHGWAPVWAWDDDTIDDPDAFPEWTGACGTEMGFLIHHYQDVLPVCEPCTEAAGKVGRRGGPGAVLKQYRFRIDVLAEAMAEKGVVANRLETGFGIPKGTVGRWLKGAYAPRPATVMQMASIFDRPWVDFYERREEA